MFVANISLKALLQCCHPFVVGSTALIQIGDTDFSGICQHPVSPHEFVNVLQVRFDDTTNPNNKNAISDDQAVSVAAFLHECYASQRNVVVQCVGGISRSGAIAEAATLLGFEDVGNFRLANELVKKKVSAALSGWHVSG